MLRIIFVLVFGVCIYGAVIEKRINYEKSVEEVKKNTTAVKTELEQSPNDKFAKPLEVEPVLAEEQNLEDLLNKNDKFARPTKIKSGGDELTLHLNPRSKRNAKDSNVEKQETKSEITTESPKVTLLNDKSPKEGHTEHLKPNPKPADDKTHLNILDVKPNQEETKPGPSHLESTTVGPSKVPIPNDKFFTQEYIDSLQPKPKPIASKKPTKIVEVIPKPEKIKPFIVMPTSAESSKVITSKDKEPTAFLKPKPKPTEAKKPSNTPETISKQEETKPIPSKEVYTSTEPSKDITSKDKEHTDSLKTKLKLPESKKPIKADLSIEEPKPKPSKVEIASTEPPKMTLPTENVEKLEYIESLLIKPKPDELKRPVKPCLDENKHEESKSTAEATGKVEVTSTTPGKVTVPDVKFETVEYIQSLSTKPGAKEPQNVAKPNSATTSQNKKSDQHYSNPKVSSSTEASKMTLQNDKFVNQEYTETSHEKNPLIVQNLKPEEKKPVSPTSKIETTTTTVPKVTIPNDKFVSQEYIQSLESNSNLKPEHKPSQEVDSITMKPENKPLESSTTEDSSKSTEEPCEDEEIIKFIEDQLAPKPLSVLENQDYVRFVTKKDKKPALIESRNKNAPKEDDEEVNFSFIRSSNLPCTTNTGNQGVCLSYFACKEANGTAANDVINNNGGCGVLSCCEISKNCGESISTKISYFESPENPGTSCRVNIRAFNENICQIRLDFLEFSLANPSQQAGAANSPISCRDDSMAIITPNGLMTPIICGTMNGQHLYIPINTTNGDLAIQLHMNLAPRPGLPMPRWKVKISQLECPNNPNAVNLSPNPQEDFVALAPSGCLQYFTENQGLVCNFGYNNRMPLDGNKYIANHKYAVCFKRLPNHCGIRFNSTNFSMSGNAMNCAGDYVFIPGAEMRSGGNTVSTDSKFCAKMMTGDTDIVSMLPGPFNIQFVSDLVGDVTENGWCLKYRLLSLGNCV